MGGNNMAEYPALNLPCAPLRISAAAEGAERVYDPLRGKFVALTPEEWVRQHFVAHLVHNLGYPPALMANEVSLTLNGTARRCDTVLFTRTGMQPLMIIEYKAPHIEITQKVFDQIVRYNMVLQARWLVVSNGMRHFCCEVDYVARKVRFVSDIPAYSGISE